MAKVVLFVFETRAHRGKKHNDNDNSGDTNHTSIISACSQHYCIEKHCDDGEGREGDILLLQSALVSLHPFSTV